MRRRLARLRGSDARHSPSIIIAVNERQRRQGYTSGVCETRRGLMRRTNDRRHIYPRQSRPAAATATITGANDAGVGYTNLSESDAADCRDAVSDVAVR